MWKPTALTQHTESLHWDMLLYFHCSDRPWYNPIIFFLWGGFFSKFQGSELVNPSRNVFSAVLVKPMEVKYNCFATFNKSFSFSQTTLGESTLKEDLLKSEEGDRLSHSNASGSRICNVDRIRIFSVQLMLCFFCWFLRGKDSTCWITETLFPAVISLQLSPPWLQELFLHSACLLEMKTEASQFCAECNSFWLKLCGNCQNIIGCGRNCCVKRGWGFIPS